MLETPKPDQRPLLCRYSNFRNWPGVRVRHVATKQPLAETAGVAGGSLSSLSGNGRKKPMIYYRTSDNESAHGGLKIADIRIVALAGKSGRQGCEFHAESRRPSDALCI